MPDLIALNIVIADRSYRLKLPPEEEEIVRKTVKLINDKIVEFKTHFQGKDMQDYVSMVLIWFATEQAGKKSSVTADSDTADRINNLELLLDKMLTTE